MDTNIIKATLLVTGVGLASCGTRSESEMEAVQTSRNQRCVTTDQSVDSAFQVAQARRALSRTEREVAPSLLQPVVDRGIELGVVVSLVTAGPNPQIGHGGLVWVDFDTGCAIVLQHYE